LGTIKNARKEREYQLRRQEIMAQAEKIFTTKGYHATTMAEIAEASGFAIGSIYLFFNGKEQLYEALIVDKMDAINRELRESCLAQDSMKGKIEALVHTHLAVVEKSENFLALLIRWEGSCHRDGKFPLVERLINNYRNHVDFISSIFEEGKDAGAFAEGEPNALALALVGILDAFAFNWLIAEKKWPLKEQAPVILQIFYRGLDRYA
jgi:TetR/AcrR family fatty acid metabolism transcriptional regulator